MFPIFVTALIQIVPQLIHGELEMGLAMKFLIPLNVTTMEQIVAHTEILTTCHLLTSGESTTLELNTCHTQPYFEYTISLTVLSCFLSSGLQIRASATAGNTQLKSGTFVIATCWIGGCRFSSFKIEIRCIAFYSHVLYLPLVMYSQYDAGGCDFVQRQYPLCLLEELGNLFSKDDDPPILGNGICESSIYNIDDCGDEVGDCTVCNSLVADKTLTGDGICHGGMHNSLDCNSDAGDCETFNARYPRCYIDAVDKISEGPVLVAVPIIGDGICNSGIYNNPDCGYEDGDCLLCNELVENSTKIGDGVCDGQNYMSDACGLDGGDCYGCPYSRLEM